MADEPLNQSQIKLLSLKNKRAVIQNRIQTCFDLGTQARNDPLVRDFFKTRFKGIKNSLHEFEAVLTECYGIELELNPNEKPDEYNEQLELFEELFYKTAEIYDRFDVSEASASSSNIMSSNVTMTVPVRKALLPEIKLKSFDGSLSQWPEFKANFQSIVHKDETLTLVAKLQYLRMSLSGPALALVKEFPITNENYTIAWNSSLERYENKRMLGADLLSKILKFPAIKQENEADVSYFLATFGECASALKSLEIPDLADFMLVQLALQCLPKGTYKAFERTQNMDDLPKTKDLLHFVQKQLQILELCRPMEVKNSPQTNEKSSKPPPFHKRTFVAKLSDNKSHAKSCVKCSQNHKLPACPQFLKWSPKERFNFVKERNLCYNCLNPNHGIANCFMTSTCKVCSQKHSALIHLDASTDSTRTVVHSVQCNDKSQSIQPSFSNNEGNIQRCVLSATNPNSVLLGTAMIHVKGKNGQFFKVRALIDSGSMTSLITTACARRLGLQLSPSTSVVTGIADKHIPQLAGATNCVIKSMIRKRPMLTTHTLVIPQITTNLPISQVPRSIVDGFKHLDLADENYHLSTEVEFLIGSDVFPEIYTGKRLNNIIDGPYALESIFGWVITGKCNPTTPQQSTGAPHTLAIHFTNVHEPIDRLLRKFWEVEDIQSKIPQHPDDLLCDQMYNESFYKEKNSNRFAVPILRKPNAPDLGNSYDQALSRFLSFEKRLTRDPTLKTECIKFMEEYESLKHMTQVNETEMGKAAYYIPYHAVIRESSTTTKVRLVFDGSMRSTSGVSLNDTLMKGAKLQQDVVDILFRFRFHLICFSADICKMYRQILIIPDHRKYQHILWRPDPSEPLREYELDTVTYGLTSSPYLSIKTVHQVAAECKSQFPDASKVIKRDFYVDDLLSGHSNIDAARTLRNEITKGLGDHGFELRKWSSNSAEFLKDIPPEHIETDLSITDENNSVKKLGILWLSKPDCFSYKVNFESRTYTKRGVLSTCARLFDPMGWVTPVISKIKIILQKLWLQGSTWDEVIPSDLQFEWDTICESLPDLTQLRIPRLPIIPNHVECHLIGFADASQLAYGASIYLRSQDSDNNMQVSLLIAKSKVAPVKTISVPKLELCAAVLLSKLIDKAQSLCQDTCTIQSTFAFSDSTVVLCWLRTLPCYLKTFVANRVTYILDKTEPEMWQHVATNFNAADIISRGCLASELIHNSLWWNGPDWLAAPIADWPKSTISPNQTVPELEVKTKTLACNVSKSIESPLIEKFSSFWKLKRVTAWFLRAIHNHRTNAPSDRRVGNLSTEELQ